MHFAPPAGSQQRKALGNQQGLSPEQNFRETFGKQVEAFQQQVQAMSGKQDQMQEAIQKGFADIQVLNKRITGWFLVGNEGMRYPT